MLYINGKRVKRRLDNDYHKAAQEIDTIMNWMLIGITMVIFAFGIMDNILNWF